MSGYDVSNGNDWSQIEQITGYFTQSEALAMQCLVKQLSPKSTVVELGSFQGRSSVVIASALPPDSILYCIDHFQVPTFNPADVLASFKNNIDKSHVADQIRLLVMETCKAAEHFQQESIDLLFIDASHDCESVKADIFHWYPKLKTGGFLVCHDYTYADWPGVAEAIKVLQLEGTLIGGSLWLHNKNKQQF
ncbi:MAG: hypothetical protein H6Q68_2324 [Firmicutes bacterium]|nr:hypothetical protein [Bacillota bacterium]